MKKIIVTGTSNVEGKPIIKYFDPISANVVIGTNVFSDISASFSDLFGGRASTYEKKLEKIYEQAKVKLKEKAIILGANCIVGFRIDIDEISGKGAQMFMITASGTPVTVKVGEDKDTNNIALEGMIDGEYIENRIRANKYLKFEKFNNDEHLQFAIDTGFVDFLSTGLNTIKHLVAKDTVSSLGGEEAQKKIDALYKYFNTLDPGVLADKIYDEFHDSNTPEYLKQLTRLLAHFELLDYSKIKKMLLSDFTFGSKLSLWLLSKTKTTYSVSDISELKELPELIINRFKPIGEISVKKKTLLSAEREVWKCSCGQVNDMGVYCTSCEKDIYGFTLKEVKPRDVYDLLNNRLAIIDQLR